MPHEVITVTPLPSLGHGRHKRPGREACVMEMASVLNGEPWSDHPRCVHPALAAVARTVNDRLADPARLAPLIPSMIGTAPSGKAAAAKLVIKVTELALRDPPHDPTLRYELEWANRSAHHHLAQTRTRRRALARDAAVFLHIETRLDRRYIDQATRQVALAAKLATTNATDEDLTALLRDCTAACRPR